MPLTNEQKSVAVGLMREYLTAPKDKDEGVTPSERSGASVPSVLIVVARPV